MPQDNTKSVEGIEWVPAASLPQVEGQVEVPFADQNLSLYADAGQMDMDVFTYHVKSQEQMAILASQLQGEERFRTETMGTNLCIRSAMILQHTLAKPFCRKMLNTPKKQVPMRFRKLRRMCVEWLRQPMPDTLLLTEIPEGYLDDDFLRHDPDVLYFLQAIEDLSQEAGRSVGQDFHKAMLQAAVKQHNYELAARAALKADPMYTQEVASA